jgi:hypothetical protein
MTSISITELLTIIFVLVDDWYQDYGHKLLKGKAGKKPVFKDSEVITLVLAHDFIPYPAETQYVGFIPHRPSPSRRQANSSHNKSPFPSLP